MGQASIPRDRWWPGAFKLSPKVRSQQGEEIEQRTGGKVKTPWGVCVLT